MEPLCYTYTVERNFIANCVATEMRLKGSHDRILTYHGKDECVCEVTIQRQLDEVSSQPQSSHHLYEARENLRTVKDFQENSQSSSSTVIQFQRLSQ